MTTPTSVPTVDQPVATPRRAPRKSSEATWRPRSTGQWLVLAGCAALMLWFIVPLYVIIATAFWWG